jgi:hypothetical protein
MFLIRIGCSDCPGEDEVVVATIDEVESLCCDCGYGYVVLAVSEAVLV